MRAATHGCNEGSIEAGWLGQSHLPVMLNYVPTANEEPLQRGFLPTHAPHHLGQAPRPLAGVPVEARARCRR